MGDEAILGYCVSLMHARRLQRGLAVASKRTNDFGAGKAKERTQEAPIWCREETGVPRPGPGRGSGTEQAQNALTVEETLLLRPPASFPIVFPHPTTLQKRKLLCGL